MNELPEMTPITYKIIAGIFCAIAWAVIYYSWKFKRLQRDLLDEQIKSATLEIEKKNHELSDDDLRAALDREFKSSGDKS